MLLRKPVRFSFPCSGNGFLCKMRHILPISLLAGLLWIHTAWAQSGKHPGLIYTSALQSPADTAGWRMEGEGKVLFQNGWMEMFSPNEKDHQVFWCPANLPADFIAEWEVQNRKQGPGLCIVFFAASGKQGEDLFSPKLPRRDGTFNQYTRGAINNYHISYYANAKDDPGRTTAHLRKNAGFHKVQDQYPGIPIHSENIHRIRLTKNQGHLLMQIDDRTVIDWQDDGKTYGPILGGGKFGFRQMKWTRFAYRNLVIRTLTP